MTRLLVAPTVLLAAVGCFQAETRVVLAADGSGSFAASTAFTPGAVAAMRELDAMAPEAGGLAKLTAALPRAPTAAERKVLGEAGLTRVKVRVVDRDDALSAAMSAKFDRPAALAAVSVLSNADLPSLTLLSSEVGNTLSFTTTRPSSAPSAPPPEMTPEQTAKATEIFMGLMAEASAFRVVVSLEVPGVIAEATPDFGVVEGPVATWTVDSSMLMARMSGVDLIGTGGYTLAFTPRRPIPAGALSSAPFAPETP